MKHRIQEYSVTDLCVVFDEIEEDDILSTSADRRMQWERRFILEHVVRQGRRHRLEILTREVILHQKN